MERAMFVVLLTRWIKVLLMILLGKVSFPEERGLKVSRRGEKDLEACHERYVLKFMRLPYLSYTCERYWIEVYWMLFDDVASAGLMVRVVVRAALRMPAACRVDARARNSRCASRDISIDRLVVW
jgi:hypothetical protein